MSDRIRLGDDGTLDTVLVCRQCGAEARYSYDSSPRDEQDNADRLEHFASLYWTETTTRLQERVDEQCYREFIDWAIDDFDSEHECEDTDNG